MADPILLPHIAQIVSVYLRARPEVSAIVGDELFTKWPKRPEFPLVWQRGPIFGNASTNPRWSARAGFDFHCYGGSETQCHTLAETVLACLALPDFIGVHEIDGEPVGVISGVEFGTSVSLPDPEYTPAKPRYVSTVAVLAHAVIPAGS